MVKAKKERRAHYPSFQLQFSVFGKNYFSAFFAVFLAGAFLAAFLGAAST